jgi:uncharacterized membrane protein
MRKDEFLKQLKKQLKDIKEEDRKDIIEDYEEHFEEAIRDGKSEEKICEDLGNPKDIAKELRAYSVIEKAENNLTFENIKSIMSEFGRYKSYKQKHKRFKADSNRKYSKSFTTEYIHCLEKEV